MAGDRDNQHWQHGTAFAQPQAAGCVMSGFQLGGLSLPQ